MWNTLRNNALVIALIAVVGGVLAYCDYRIDRYQCDQMMANARTHADSLVVESTAPYHNSMSCFVIRQIGGEP